MIVVIRRRSTARLEKEAIRKGGELATAHRKGLLGKHYYTEDKTGVNTGKKGQPYLSPKRLQKKI